MPQTLPTDRDQLMLELINRARANPQAEATRLLGGNLNEGLSPGTISTDAKQPLAFNLNLNAAAEGHSQWMLDNNVFSHTGANGSSSGTRMAEAGYPFTGGWGRGENLAWKGTTGTVNFTQYVIDNHDNLFVDAGVSGRGHRLNLMNASYREVGISSIQGLFTTSSGTTYNSVMTTQDFAYSSNRGPFLTGVAYTDAVTDDDFYTVGEGLGNVTVTAVEVSNPSNTASTTTWSSGGYNLELSSGTYDVTFSGDFNNDGQTDTVTQSATIGSTNVKLDLATDTINFAPTPTSGSDNLTGSAGNDSIKALGGNDIVDGGDGSDTLLGAGGNDVLNGEAGNDRLLGGNGNDELNGGDNNDTLFGQAGADLLQGNFGSDVLNGGTENDTLFGGEDGDTLIGHNDDDVLNGEAGDDRLLGGNGNDELNGGDNNDTLFGQAGTDLLNGGSGNDKLIGGTDNDILSGGDDRDTLIGQDGDDLLTGNSGNDRLLGGNGNDTLLGTDETAAGVGEQDVLRGNAGRDRFVLGDSTQAYYLGNSNLDRAIVADFTLGEDRIQLHGSAAEYQLREANGHTQIRSSGDLVAIVQNSTGLALNDPSVFEYAI
ncbi:MAG TPA: hemolysin [Oscillatoriales cyanobacterium M59_W2019_021]|nr:hemolysin [Oscillatoriales cyanobacterium M4454_W2019_049]HIK50574.1 hemolysin [Oscillatoriales cyanobacterium M59_W2019_021]